VSKETREELRELGKKGETYDQLLHRLIETARKVAFFKEIDYILENEEFVPLDEI
jgi:hypothetical protein